MRWLVIWVLSAVPLWAEELPEDQAAVVACIGALDQGAEWGQCMAALFEPCASHEIQSEDHLGCLMSERGDWLDTIEVQQTDLSGRLTDRGATELGDLMSQWRGYVANKCSSVGANFTGTGAEVAQAGCEITEMAALVGELISCREGRSIAPYCVLQE